MNLILLKIFLSWCFILTRLYYYIWRLHNVRVDSLCFTFELYCWIKLFTFSSNVDQVFSSTPRRPLGDGFRWISSCLFTSSPWVQQILDGHWLYLLSSFIALLVRLRSFLLWILFWIKSRSSFLSVVTQFFNEELALQRYLTVISYSGSSIFFKKSWMTKLSDKASPGIFCRSWYQDKNYLYMCLLWWMLTA